MHTYIHYMQCMQYMYYMHNTHTHTHTETHTHTSIKHTFTYQRYGEEFANIYQRDAHVNSGIGKHIFNANVHHWLPTTISNAFKYVIKMGTCQFLCTENLLNVNAHHWLPTTIKKTFNYVIKMGACQFLCMETDIQSECPTSIANYY